MRGLFLVDTSISAGSWRSAIADTARVMGEMWRRGQCYQLQVIGRILLVAFVPLATLMKHVHRKALEADPDYQHGE